MTNAMVKTENAVEVVKHSELLNKWLSFAQVSASSVKAYSKAIRNLFKFFETSEIETIDRAAVISYRDFLKAKYSAATVNLYISATKLFFSFLYAEKILSENPAEHIKGLKIVAGHKRDALSKQAVKSVYSTFDANTVKGLRDRAMFALMATAGLRTIEVARADVSDILTTQGKHFLLVQGKGRNDKTEKVLIADGVYNMIEEYLQAAQIGEKSALFISVSNRNYGKRMTANSISRIIKNAMKAAGYSSRRLTAHSLRHTAATVALRGGVALRQVQQMLRHASIAVTEIYLHELDRLSNNAESVVAASFGF